jgi:hypothetical protein
LRQKDLRIAVILEQQGQQEMKGLDFRGPKVLCEQARPFED